jgi:hypothetical protein
VFLRAVAEQATRTGYAVGIGKAEEIGQIVSGALLLIALRSGGRRPLLLRGPVVGPGRVRAEKPVQGSGQQVATLSV